VRGVYHQVRAGDTLEALATRYDVAVADIASYPLNQLRPGQPLQAGVWLVIPYGSKALRRPRPALALDSLFAWPIVGYVTQNYSADHPALDIGAPYGSAVYAARAGVVTRASWADTGYGYLVWIEHGDGYATVYSHLKGAWVSAGQRVARGQLVGEVGSTGNSTGPHVHFEIRVNGVRANPLGYLPADP
jgi:murein DD-endopeptidase MepM/ murein hydrolase activator NlpD